MDAGHTVCQRGSRQQLFGDKVVHFPEERLRPVTSAGYGRRASIRRFAWDRGPMRIKARVIQIWAFCVPAVLSVIRDGTCPAGGQR